MQEIRNKYSRHKSKAKHRGIDFMLSFDEWWDIWQLSGKWELRGPNKGQYVMSRNNDTGPYALGNVFIQLSEDNHRDVVHSANTKKVMSQKKLGVPKSDEWREKIRLSNLGKKKPPTLITCLHCNKTGATNLMKRWHFDNCKEKKHV